MNEERLRNTETHDQIKLRLRGIYQSILGRQLTPADIDTFADEVIGELVTLTEEVASSYTQENSLSEEELKGKDFEDKAFEYYKLQNVSDLLERAQEKLETMRVISSFVIKNIRQEHLGEVITPPEKQSGGIDPGDGEGEKFVPDMIPRLKTALYILREGGVPLDSITLMDGIVTPDMMRRTSYVTIVIPQIDRLMQVCDEEGNASYIFKLSSVNVEDMNRMSKPEKNDLITSNPGIGVRFKQGPRWRERVESYLFEEIPSDILVEGEEVAVTRTPEGQEVLTPLFGELDPWRGFAVDKDGQHWGTRSAITKKLGKSYVIFRKRINDSRLETCRIVDVQGRIQAGYCFEQLKDLFPELFTERQIEKEGEWKGFWTDPETGKHWASGGVLMSKFNVGDWKTIKRYAAHDGLPSIEINNRAGRQAEAYSYEDFMALEPFMDFLTAPQVEQEGEDTGFWIDSRGRHWASIGVLASYFKTKPVTVKSYAGKAQLPSMALRSRTGEVSLAFSREDLEANQQFREFTNMPKGEKEGEWASFLIDKDNKHWGSQWRIAQKLNTSEHVINRLVSTHPELHSQTMKDAMGKPQAGFCYEEIYRIMYPES